MLQPIPNNLEPVLRSATPPLFHDRQHKKKYHGLNRIYLIQPNLNDVPYCFQQVETQSEPVLSKYNFTSTSNELRTQKIKVQRPEINRSIDWNRKILYLSKPVLNFTDTIYVSVHMRPSKRSNCYRTPMKIGWYYVKLQQDSGKLPSLIETIGQCKRGQPWAWISSRRHYKCTTYQESRI